MREMAQQRMEALLLNDELDAGIAFADSGSRDIVATPLFSETLALVVGRHHPLAGQRRMKLEALNQQSLILLSEEFATRGQIDSYCRQHGIQPTVHMEANSISAVLTVIQHTQLATLLPAAIVRGPRRSGGGDAHAGAAGANGLPAAAQRGLAECRGARV